MYFPKKTLKGLNDFIVKILLVGYNKSVASLKNNKQHNVFNTHRA